MILDPPKAAMDQQQLAVEFILDTKTSRGWIAAGTRTVIDEFEAWTLFHDQTKRVHILGKAEDFPELGAARVADIARSTAPLDLILQPQSIGVAGASQYSRCDTEARVIACSVKDQLMTITTAAAHEWLTGLEVFCTVPGHQVYGVMTVTGDTTMTIPVPGRKDSTFTDGTGEFFVHVNGMHAGASWLGHCQSYFGAGMRLACNASKHGDDINEVKARLPSIIEAIKATRPSILIFEPGWGNSINNGATFDQVIGQALENIRAVARLVPVVLIATLPPVAPGAGLTAAQIGNFHRTNVFTLTKLRSLVPNVTPVDCTRALIDPTRTDAGSIADVHSDTLHWTPLGAKKLAEDCWIPVLARMMPRIPTGRRFGASDVWTNDGNQLYDDLLDATGYEPAGSQAGSVLDNSMTITRSGGSGTAALSKPTVSGASVQRLDLSAMANTCIYTLSIKGSAGKLLKDRLQAGRTYNPVLTLAINSVSAGAIRLSTMFRLTFSSGHAGTGPRIAWSGRTQRGAVELGGSGYRQNTAETAREYIGQPFTIPAGAVISDAELTVVIESGTNGSATQIDIVDVSVRPVTII